MNIQMLLSALPNQLSGKQDAGAAPGHFALAMNQANGISLFDGSALPAQPVEMIQGGLPPTMAAHQALLQALHANAEHGVDGESAQADVQAQLDEIMVRLALIDSSFSLEQDADANVASLPLTDTDLKVVSDVKATEDGELHASALVAAAVAAPSNSEMRAPYTDAAPLATGGQTAAAQTQAALSTALPQTSMAAERGFADTAESPTRSTHAADFSAALARAPQPSGDPRTLTQEAPRVGFVPETTPMTQTPTGATAQMNTALPSGMPSQASLSAPVHSPAWSGQLSQQMVQFARLGGEQQVEMRLNPAELGPLSITLKMTEQGAQAQFLAAHAQVRQVLEQAIPQLREALAEQGITLGETSVGEQRRQDAQAFANGNGNGGKGQAGADSNSDDALVADEDATNVSAVTLPLDGRVNLYA
ncbi:MAG: flagellar hook-length control protein FliK [Halomonas sp.]|nr:flagellar hook-length control protein FliK [Halomonas sp.]MCC5883926.1 flagellar hook-length control protein FliK [Halomonas sp.]